MKRKHDRERSDAVEKLQVRQNVKPTKSTLLDVWVYLSSWVSVLSHPLMSPCHMTEGAGSGQECTCVWNRNEDAPNLKLCLEAKPEFWVRDNLCGIYLCWRTEAWDQHWTKIHELATKADGVALMPTSYECEDYRSAISSATVHVHAFRS